MSALRYVMTLCSVFIVVGDAQILRKEAYETVPQLITAAGYPVERHRVQTPDGYVLQMHRIPAGRRTARRAAPAGKGKRAVLVMHGLLGSSGDFLIMGPDRSLGFILADAGYDVWLGNLRGNMYTTHLNLTKNDPRFWEFSFHEHGKYDVPSQIDKVLSVTGQQRLLYVGYSMGTTSFFTMMSERPEYNDKVVAFVALAPAVFMDNMRPLAELVLKTWNLPRTMRAQGMISVNVRPDLRDLVLSSVCQAKSPEEDMCMRLFYTLVGEDYDQNDWDMMTVILARFQPASWRQVEHFGKIALNGVFTSWGDGLWGTVKPYDLAKVRVPVTLLYGENDQLTEKTQIMRLAKELRSSGVLEDVRPGCQWPRFNHLDFVFAKDVGKLLNRPLVKHIDKMFNKYGPS